MKFFGKIFFLLALFLFYNDASAVIKDFVLNPTGSSMAVIQKYQVDIYAFTDGNMRSFAIEKRIKRLIVQPAALSLTYSTDAKYLAVSASDGKIILFDTQKYQKQFTLQGEMPATSITMSPDNYFIVAVMGKTINIWDFEAKTIRTKLTLDTEAQDAAFATDGSLLAVTTADYQLIIYNTRNWEIVYTYRASDKIFSPSFNADDKYVAFVVDGQEISILDFRKKSIIRTIEQNKTIYGCKFFYNKLANNTYIIANRSESIIFQNINNLAPFYQKLVNQEVDKKMNEWVKMMQDESMEDYKIRVNDETRLKQMEIFTEEATNALAADRISIENPFVGDYDDENGLLSINFTSLAPIEIAVPESERSSFGDNAKLKFSNAVYRLNEQDEFVLAYIEVTNEVNNKVYIYDNIGRSRLEAIEVDLDIVPLEILQIVSQEEANLVSAKEEMIEKSKQENLITDNTRIDVHTEALLDFDAEGNKILNYRVDYKYEVINKDFSEKEDFPSGNYVIENSNAAISLMKIIKQSFEEGDIAKYLDENKSVRITIIGSADGSPIRKKIAYDGRYGEYVFEPYYQNGDLNNITITKASGITENEQLAFLRAASVKDYLSRNIATLQKTKNDYRFDVEVSKEQGGQYRKITIQFTIIDAFKQ
jgi:hypothetical protein